MKIWFRVGMEADVTEAEMKILYVGGEKAHTLMREIINRATVSGETYIPEGDNINELENNPNIDIEFNF